MSVLETAVLNGEQLTFALLFVGLLIWVMKTNQKRELKYEQREKEIQIVNNEREERYQKTINDLTTALKGYDDVRETVKRIDEKLK